MAKWAKLCPDNHEKAVKTVFLVVSVGLIPDLAKVWLKILVPQSGMKVFI